MADQSKKKAIRKIEEYKDQVKKEGENLVKNVFPRTVCELNELIQAERLQMARINKIETNLNIPVPDPIHFTQNGPDSKKRKVDPLAEVGIQGSKVLALLGGAVPSNHHIIELVDEIKPKIRELIDNANKTKMWIAYSIPKIEDGNNFGVSIQEDIMAEARQVEADAATYLDQISRYFITRGKIISKVAKYPHVEDYRRTIKELDEKEFVSIRLVAHELRNHYASLHDVIMKNMDKIKKPRSSNADNLY